MERLLSFELEFNQRTHTFVGVLCRRGCHLSFVGKDSAFSSSFYGYMLFLIDVFISTDQMTTCNVKVRFVVTKPQGIFTQLCNSL